MFWENHLLLKTSRHSYHRKIMADLVILVFLLFTLWGLLSSARADAVQHRIVDNEEILSEKQIDNMQTTLSAFHDFPLVIIVNEVGNRCTDDYAYSSAKLFFHDLFSSDEEGLVLVYCDSLEGYKIGIYYQGPYDINITQLKNNITSEYTIYSSDASWIEGSSITFINSIIEILHPTAEPTPKAGPSEEVPPSKPSFWEQYGKYQLMVSILSTAFLAGIVLAIIIYRKHRKQIDKDIEYWLK